MREQFYLRQRIHIVADFTADDFANPLYFINPPYNSIIINAKEQRTAQTIGKSAHTFQPTLWFSFFQL